MLKKAHNYYPIYLIIFIFNIFSCKQIIKQHEQTKADTIKKKMVKEWNKTIPGNFSDQTKAVFDSTEIIKFLKKYPAMTYMCFTASASLPMPGMQTDS
jgi:hypothetical protein